MHGCRSCSEHETQDKVGAAAGHGRPRPRRRVQLADHPRGHPRAPRATRREGSDVVFYATGRRGVSLADVPRARARGSLHRLHRPPGLRQRARDRRGPDGRLRRRRGRPRRDLLQRLRLPAHAGGAPRDAAAAAARDDPRGRRARRRRTTRRGAHEARQARARRVRAGPRRDPRSASSPTTSRSRSTARCWSPPRPSTARA